MAVLFYYSQTERKADAKRKVRNPTFNCKYPTLHEARPGDIVWVITREKGEYILLRKIVVDEIGKNKPGTSDAAFGEYRVDVRLSESLHYPLGMAPVVTDIIVHEIKKSGDPQAFRGSKHVMAITSPQSDLLAAAAASVKGEKRHY